MSEDQRARVHAEVGRLLLERGHQFSAPACCQKTVALLMHECASLDDELVQSDVWIVESRITAEPYLRTLWQRGEAEGAAALREASTLYEKWGALAKVQALAREAGGGSDHD
jgi:hypothetical protein